MHTKYIVGDIVSLVDKSYFNNLFQIVGDKKNPMKGVSPFTYNYDTIKLKDGFDYILAIKKKDGNLTLDGISKDGLHVKEHEIEGKITDLPK